MTNNNKSKSTTTSGKRKRSAQKYVKYNKALQDDLVVHQEGTGYGQGIAIKIWIKM